MTHHISRYVTCQGLWDFRYPGLWANLRHVPPPKPRDVTDATSFADAIDLLRAKYGSDDKLAKALGMNANGRFTVMRWRQGSFPEPEYRERLGQLGVPAALLIPPTSVEELWGVLRRVEAEVVRIRRALEVLGPAPD